MRLPIFHGQRWSRQYRSQRKANPLFTIAQDRSPPIGERHQAAVRLPTPSPSDRQRIVGPLTSTWPSRLLPVGRPTSRTSASLASTAPAAGQGWLSRQLPSISRAAMPERRIRGPSAHQIGPSPSQTRVGVQSNDWPAGTIEAARNSKRAIACAYRASGRSCKQASSSRGIHDEGTDQRTGTRFTCSRRRCGTDLRHRLRSILL